MNNLGDYDEDWGPTALYIQGIGIDKLISRQDANGVRYYHADALGTTRLMTKGDQSIAATYAYDAWGKIKAHTGEGSNRHKFTGREWDAEISLQYNRARFYDPEIGRWITQDPLTKGPDDPTVSYKDNLYAYVGRVAKEYLDAFDQNRRINRYVYVCNNPINFIDPLGLEDWLIVVPGTQVPERLAPDAPGWAREGSPDREAMQKTFNTDNAHTMTLEWTGGNRREARSEAAESLSSKISDIRKTDSGANIAVVGHSHGGNVAIESSNRNGSKIDQLITLGTPARDDYRPNSQNIGQHTNIYDKKDAIQSLGGKMDGIEVKNPITGNKVELGHKEWGPAGREFSGAKNVPVDTQSRNGLEAHVKLHDEKVWTQQIDPVVRQQQEQKQAEPRTEQKQAHVQKVETDQ